VLGIGLALVSSVLWGSADFLAGLANRRAPLVTVLAGTQLAGLALVGLVLVAHGEGPPHDVRLGYAALGAFGAVVGLGALYRGLALGPMGVVAPVSALSGTVPVLVGLALGERPSGLQLFGMLLSLVGVALAAAVLSPSPGRYASWVAAGLGLLAATGIGAALVGLGAASEAHPVWAVVVLRLVVVAALAGGLVVRLALRRRSVRWRVALPSLPTGRLGIRQNPGWFLGVQLVAAGTLDAGANLLFGVASTAGMLSIVGLLGSLYPVSTVVLARFVLDERLRPVQLAGVGAVLAGVSAVSLG
jgi:drug/metabolite transporter (DMT)-like permease